MSAPGVGAELPAPDGETSALVLPPSGSGRRRDERRARQARLRERRRRVARRSVAVVALVAVVGGGAVVGRAVLPDLLDRSSGAAAPDAPEPVDAALVADTDAPRALLVLEDRRGRLAGATVLAVAPAGDGGHLLLLPVGAMVEVPSFGLQPLRAAYADGGLPLLRTSVENLLGLRFDSVHAVGADEVATVVPSPLRVELPDAVEAVGDDGRVEVLFDRGANDVAPDEVLRLLTALGDGSELDRLVRHEAFWRAWLPTTRTERGRGAAERGLGEVAEPALALARGDLRVDVLPVEAVATGSDDDSGLYRVREDELDQLRGRVLPEAAGAAGARTRVQVLNGTGEPGLVQRVQPMLVAAGARVTLTGNADRFGHDRTQVVYYDDAQLEAARSIREALGVGEVVKSLSGLVVVDVTVVVGEDLAPDG